MPLLLDGSLSSKEFGQYQTATRLLSSLINDGLIDATPYHHKGLSGQPGLLLHSKTASDGAPAVWVAIAQAGTRHLNAAKGQILSFPGDFTTPILLTQFGCVDHDWTREFDPATLLTHLRNELVVSDVSNKLWNQVCRELDSSCSNQRYWYEWAEKRKPLTLQSPMLEFEQACYTGHPLHPMHRSLATEAPMPKVNPEAVASLMRHSVSFISVPGHDIRISGPFRALMRPLMTEHGLINSDPRRLIMPCLTMQIPVLETHHPDLIVVKRDAFTVDTQSSMRTVSASFMDIDLKFALDVKIGSALRTITPWTSCIVSELSMVLNEILPSNLWLLDDVASVTGSGEDFNRAKHIGCIVRRNFRKQMTEANEMMMVTGALQEVPPNSEECNAAIVFKLNTRQQKMAWFTKYTEGLIDAFMSPVVDHGCAFESHAQNVILRVDRTTGAMKGFATRDLGSIKIHMPTLASSGHELFSAMPGSFVAEQNEEAMWQIIHFCTFHNHLNVFMYRIGIDRNEGWTMIREKLDAFLETRMHLDNTPRLKAWLYQKEVSMKAFMVMKFGEQARTYNYVKVPNVLLEGM